MLSFIRRMGLVATVVVALVAAANTWATPATQVSVGITESVIISVEAKP